MQSKVAPLGEGGVYLPEFAQTHVHWVYDAILPSLPLSPPAPLALNLSQDEESFSMSWCFPSGGQRIGASASVFSMIIRVISFRIDWFDLLGVQGTRVFSSTTVRKHQFFGTQPSLWSNFHIRTWSLYMYMRRLSGIIWVSASEKEAEGDFPGGPVVKTLCFHCKGHNGFHPCSGN